MENINSTQASNENISNLIEILSDESIELDELVFGRCKPSIC